MATPDKNVLTDRKRYADLIEAQLRSAKERLATEFRQSGRIQSCFVDDLLPEPMARQIFAAFPNPSEMMARKRLHEHKFVAAQMDRYNPVLEEIVFAFQDPGIVKLAEEITGLAGLLPDEHLSPRALA
jgi:hypothetical protein